MKPCVGGAFALDHTEFLTRQPAIMIFALDANLAQSYYLRAYLCRKARAFFDRTHRWVSENVIHCPDCGMIFHSASGYAGHCFKKGHRNRYVPKRRRRTPFA